MTVSKLLQQWPLPHRRCGKIHFVLAPERQNIELHPGPNEHIV